MGDRDESEDIVARQLTNPTHRTDVVVVGAGCAGAATALLLASAGHDVVLVDRSALPSDTLSTHALGMLVAPRRHVLDPLLVEAAVAAGARLTTGVTVDGVRRRFDGRVTGITGRSDNHVVEISARFVVGGHGISVAFRDAELLAAALDDVIRGKDDERSALADYHAMRDSRLPTPGGP